MKPINRPPTTGANGPVRTLMRDGKWLVPPSQRPKVLPPPEEWSEARKKADKIISPLNHMNAECWGKKARRVYGPFEGNA